MWQGEKKELKTRTMESASILSVILSQHILCVTADIAPEKRRFRQRTMAQSIQNNHEEEQEGVIHVPALGVVYLSSAICFRLC